MGGGGVGVMRGLKFYLFIYLFIYFEQVLFRGSQFSEAGLNGALMKRKNTKNTIKKADKKAIGTTKYSESIGGSIWPGSKVPF